MDGHDSTFLEAICPSVLPDPATLFREQRIAIGYKLVWLSGGTGALQSRPDSICLSLSERKATSLAPVGTPDLRGLTQTRVK